MQPVNDDMDNLFRRAAEDFPLNTNGASFDKVRQQLEAEITKPEKKEKSRKYLWLLLLLLVPIPFLYQHYQGNAPLAPSHKQAVAVKNKANTRDNNCTPATNNTITENKKDDTQTLAIINENNKKEKINSVNTQPATQTDNTPTLPTNNSSFNNNVVAKKQSVANDFRSKQTRKSDHSSASLQPVENRNRKQSSNNILQSAYPKNKDDKNNNLITNKTAKDSIEKLASELVTTTQLKNSSNSNPIKDSSLQSNTTKQINDATALAKANKRSDSSENSKPVNASKKTDNRKKPSVYVGVAMGPDFSTVKSNKSNGPGYNIGLIAGYHMGKHLAFETGILWNYKKYYSDGKHVSTEKLNLYNHTEIIYLDGTYGIIEIPVSVRYHFTSKGKSNWYAGTGVSSYIMKKEDYYYKYKRYNVEYYSEKEYTNSSKNWFSVLQFNIGYQLNIKKTGSLRIEPYLKLPIHGLGIGNLPLSGGGINVGFTLPIH